MRGTPTRANTQRVPPGRAASIIQCMSMPACVRCDRMTAIAATCHVMAANMSVCPAACRRPPRSPRADAPTASQPNHRVPTAKTPVSTSIGTIDSSPIQVGRATISSMTTAITRCRTFETRWRPFCGRVSS